MSPIAALWAGLLGPVVSFIGVMLVFTNERRKINAAAMMQQRELDNDKKTEELERLRFEKGIRDEIRDENKSLKIDKRELEERVRRLEEGFELKSHENSDMRATLSTLMEQNANYRIDLEKAIKDREIITKENILLKSTIEDNRKEISELRTKLDNFIGEMKGVENGARKI